MARSTIAEATIIDLSDGTSPITAFLTNANHSFSASELGVVDNVAGFTTSVTAFIGQTQGTYVTSANYDAANEYTITAAAYVGTATGWGTPAISNTGAVTIPSISSTATESVTLRITFSVRDANNNSVTGLTQDCTLSIIKQGAGGNVINLSPEGQAFTANSSGALDSGQDDIIMTIELQGTPGTLTVSTSTNGGAYTDKSSVADTAGNVKGFDTDGTGTFTTSGTISGLVNGSRLLISSNNLGNANENLTVRVTGANGGSDFVTFYKVKTGAEGAAALIAIIESNSNGFVFKNNAGTAKTLTCKVYDAADGTELTGSSVTYHWMYSDGTDVRVASASSRTVQSSGGVIADGTEYPNIIFGPEDVENVVGLRCEVDVSDS